MIETHSFQKLDKIANKDCRTDGIIHLYTPGVLEPIAAKDPEEYGPDENDCVGENRVRLLCSEAWEWSVGRTEERELVGMDGNAAAEGGLLDDLPMTPNDVDTKELAPLDGLALCAICAATEAKFRSGPIPVDTAPRADVPGTEVRFSGARKA
jgi:hypothetical protein